MRSSKRVVAGVTAALAAACATPGEDTRAPTTEPGLGRAVTPQEIAAGTSASRRAAPGFPPAAARRSRAKRCTWRNVRRVTERKAPASRRMRWSAASAALGTPKQLLTVGSFWPYATTLFDYTRRAMPTTKPMSLTNDQVYAVTAYILFLNGIIPESAEMNAQTLPQVKMPNRDGFVDKSGVR